MLTDEGRLSKAKLPRIHRSPGFPSAPMPRVPLLQAPLVQEESAGPVDADRGQGIGRTVETAADSSPPKVPPTGHEGAQPPVQAGVHGFSSKHTLA